MKSLGVLIKPASGLCNLSCKYCFYHDEASNREVSSYGLMSEETACALIDGAAAFVGDGGGITFAFQGGEPTVRGRDFYEFFCARAREVCEPRHISTGYSIQTNGTLLDEPFVRVLAENGFLVGLSVDGHAALHDKNRIYPDGTPTHADVLGAAALLKENSVDFNILCVVTEEHSRCAAALYKWFKKQGFRFLQFIPQIPPIGVRDGGVSPSGYGRFLCELFDVWYEDFRKGDYISIRDFDNICGMVMGRPPELCSMRGRCSVSLVSEANGDLYPCDFYVLDAYKLGNVGEISLEEAFSCETARSFISSSDIRSPECTRCRWLSLCRTGCRRYKEPLAETDGRNYFCDSYRRFFAHAFERMKTVDKLLSEKYGVTPSSRVKEAPASNERKL